MLSRLENLMMTMTTMADGLEAQDSSKSAFMEFGQQSHSQQSSPSMAASHYPLHCLHSGSHPHHPQHDNSPYPGTNSYNRSLPYSYVSHSHHSPYLPSYNNTGGQSRLDGTGKTAAFSFFFLFFFLPTTCKSNASSLYRWFQPRLKNTKPAIFSPNPLKVHLQVERERDDG